MNVSPSVILGPKLKFSGIAKVPYRKMYIVAAKATSTHPEDLTLVSHSKIVTRKDPIQKRVPGKIE